MIKKIYLCLLCMPLLGITVYAGEPEEPEPARAEYYYIKEGGAGNKDASSWENASSSIGYTISRANIGDTVYVAAGTYKEKLAVKDGVLVFGGFPADADENTTLWDRELPGSGKNLTILDGDNKYRPLTQYYLNRELALWDGFIIQNGKIIPGDGFALTASNGEAAACVYDYDQDSQTGKAITLFNRVGEWGGYGHDVETLPNIQDKNQAVLDMDGISNTDNIYHFLERNGYPTSAAHVVYQETEGNYGDWYLPALGELVDIFNKRSNINNWLMQIPGADHLGENFYWSSTEYHEFFAWRVRFSSGEIHHDSKIVPFMSIRAIRNFDLKKSLATTTAFNGGGVHLLNNTTLRNCIVRNNEAYYRGGGVFANGATIEGCLIHDNKAIDATGAFTVNTRMVNVTSVKNKPHEMASESEPYPQIGDFYYSDDTYSSTLDRSKTAIGVVLQTSKINPYRGRIVSLSEQATNWSAIDDIVQNETGWEAPTYDDFVDLYKDVNAPNGKIQEALRSLNGSAEIGRGNYWIGDEGGYVNILKLSRNKINDEANTTQHTLRLIRSF